MKRNVVSFLVAIRAGLEPREYTYDPDKIPVGEYEAVLEAKTWSKRIIAINCYFTKIDTGEKFIVTAYCNNQTGKYDLGGGTVDFGTCPLAATYRIRVGWNTRGKIMLQAAALIS